MVMGFMIWQEMFGSGVAIGMIIITIKKNESLSINPKGPNQSFDPQEPYSKKRVLRGGSFLCNSSYCSGYRVTARMKSSPDSGMSHTGFRCACN